MSMILRNGAFILLAAVFMCSAPSQAKAEHPVFGNYPNQQRQMEENTENAPGLKGVPENTYHPRVASTNSYKNPATTTIRNTNPKSNPIWENYPNQHRQMEENTDNAPGLKGVPDGSAYGRTAPKHHFRSSGTVTNKVAWANYSNQHRQMEENSDNAPGLKGIPERNS